MKWDEILSLVDSIIIVFVAVVLALEFFDTKDGTLRKIMISLFCSISIIYSVGGVVLVMQSAGFWDWVTLANIRWITATPLAIVMVWFLYYWLYQMKKQ